MKLDQKIIARMDELIAEGQQVIGTARARGGLGASRAGGLRMTPDRVDEELAYKWATSSLNLIEKAFTKTSTHFETFKGIYGRVRELRAARECLGILRSAK